MWRTAHRLHQVFAGQALTECDLRWPGLSTLNFAGHTTIEVVPRGKHLLQRLSGGWTIHSHLRMEDSWRIEKTDAAAPPRGDAVRAVLATQAYRAVGRSLGELDVVRTADEARLVGHLGPDLLGPDWDLERAVANLLDTDAPLAAALLDQTRVAGLGTMWTAEALFLEGLDPFAPAAERDGTVLAALLGRARRLTIQGSPHVHHCIRWSHAGRRRARVSRHDGRVAVGQEDHRGRRCRRGLCRAA